jgi:two-component system LytT family response regulator
MIDAIIIEDEKSSMEYLRSILKKKHPNITIRGWASNVDAAVALITSKNPDIVFLDIQLNDGSGFDVLDRLESSMPFEVIFTTGFLDYKERAMDYFAFYYLNKPVQEDEIKKVLDMYELKRSAFDMRKYQAFKNQLESKNHTITIFERSEYTSLKFSDIIYCEAGGNYTHIYNTKGKNLLSSKNLKKIEDIIESPDFYRVHRSFLVNLTHIKEFTRDGQLIMSDGNEIIISSRNRKKVVDFLIDYMEK